MPQSSKQTNTVWPIKMSPWQALEQCATCQRKTTKTYVCSECLTDPDPLAAEPVERCGVCYAEHGRLSHPDPGLRPGETPPRPRPAEMPPRARIVDPPSSHAAAAKIAARAPEQHRACRRLVCSAPGLTTRELARYSLAYDSPHYRETLGPDEGSRVHVLGRRLPELRTAGDLRNVQPPGAAELLWFPTDQLSERWAAHRKKQQPEQQELTP